MAVDTEILDDLVSRLSEDFLSSGHIGDTIGLFNHEQEILEYLRKGIRNYLVENGREVDVGIGEGTGYKIDVGYYLKCFPNIFDQ